MDIFYDLFEFVWLIALSLAVLKLWDKEQEQDRIEDWEPVDLNDSREWELEEQAKRKKYFMD